MSVLSYVVPPFSGHFALMGHSIEEIFFRFNRVKRTLNPFAVELNNSSKDLTFYFGIFIKF